MSDETSRIGPYRLLQVLGEGGMGIVYEAEQVEPVRRRVALKVLQSGMDSKIFVARFEAERQALAVMDHRNIARVYDAGTTDEGRPYYVMELVAGLPITSFCDDQRLRTRDRLALFVDVCYAVQHAHQKGVIHRDLKPSNILVALQDDRPVPKVIDFGIAKALGGRLTDKTLVTAFGQPLGTPAYMSPEQWEGSQLDIDTRSDIYSLGVILYELLVGGLPIDPRQLARAGVAASHLVRNTPRDPPSTRFRSLGDEVVYLAQVRGSDPQSLARELRGDLDWITLKALEPDRSRRYETAHSLSLDIGRHLRAEPVLARPPSAGYRLSRFLRRHPVGGTVAAALVVLAAGFTTMTVIQARRLAIERDRAAEEAAKATALNRFLEQTLLSPDPIEGLGRNTTMVQALDSAVARLRSQPISSPPVEAAVKSAIGWAYYKLGLYDQSGPLLTEALALRRRHPGPDSLELGESLMRAGALYQVRAEPDSAASLYQQGLAIRRQRLGASAPELAGSLTRIGGFFRDRGDTASARGALVEAAAIYSRLGDSSGLAAVDNQMGVLEYGLGHLSEAERRFRASLDLRRRALGRHALVAEALGNLGAVLDEEGQLAEAEAAYREALAIAIDLLGEEHDEVTGMVNNLALLLARQGRPAEAESLFRRNVRVDQGKLGRDHPAVAVDLINLAGLVCRTGGTAEAVELARRAQQIFERHHGPSSWEAAQARVTGGRCLSQLGRFTEAERALLAGLRALQQTLGDTHWRVDSARVRLRDLYLAWGKPDRAQQLQP
jgi:serine/threonine protein kinase/Flp pilus assembly protein TadD